MLNRPGPVLRTVFRLPVYLYRWKLGWVLGHRFLLIIHTGRRTSALHQTVVEVLHYDSSSGEAVVMSGWGSRSDWFRHVEAAGIAKVVVGRRRFPVTHRVLDEEEASRVLADYERRNRWITPVVRKVLGGRHPTMRRPEATFRPTVQDSDANSVVGGARDPLVRQGHICLGPADRLFMHRNSTMTSSRVDPERHYALACVPVYAPRPKRCTRSQGIERISTDPLTSRPGERLRTPCNRQ